MRRPASPANAIRAFEASAAPPQLQTRAAQELAVTPGGCQQAGPAGSRLAAGQAVPADWKGRLELTQAGHVYVNPAARAPRPDRGMPTAHPARRGGTACLSISTTPPLCRQMGLVPRLARLQWPPTRRSEVRVATFESAGRFRPGGGFDLRGPASAPVRMARAGGQEAVRRGGLPGVRAGADGGGPHPLDRARGPAAPQPCCMTDSLGPLALLAAGSRGCRRSSGPADPRSAIFGRISWMPGWPGGGWRWARRRAGGRSNLSVGRLVSRSVWSPQAYGFKT